MKNLILIITMIFGFFTLNPIFAQNTKTTKSVVAKPINEKMAEPILNDIGNDKEIQMTTDAKICRQGEARKMQNETIVKSQLKKETKSSAGSMKNSIETKNENMKKPNPSGKVYHKNTNEGNVKYKKGEMKPNVPATDNKAKLEAPKTQEKTK